MEIKKKVTFWLMLWYKFHNKKPIASNVLPNYAVYIAWRGIVNEKEISSKVLDIVILDPLLPNSFQQLISATQEPFI